MRLANNVPLALAVGLCACVLLAGCAGDRTAERGNEETDMTESEPEQIIDKETETEAETAPEEIVLPAERRIDFTAFDEAMLATAFPATAATEVALCPDGVQFTARMFTTDPQVRFDIDALYGALGYAETENGSHVPFIPEETGAVVIRLRSTESGVFEFFYAAGDIAEATAGRSVTGNYLGGGDWQYLVLDFDGKEGYTTRFNDRCRLDWSTGVRGGDTMTVAELLFFLDARTAEKYIGQNGGSVQSAMGNTGYGTAERTGKVEAGYYVCLYQNKLGTDAAGVLEYFGTDSLADAQALCDSEKQYGYRVVDETGAVVYAPYTLLQCDILREAKYVTDYARENGFTYGDAPINPAIDHRAKKVSCDRLVCWVLYRAGFTDQPFSQGVVVSAMHTWAEKNGFTEITDKTALEPGDIVLVHPNKSGTYALHTFLYAGETDTAGVFYRYDHGSDARIQSDQPNAQPLELDGAPFWRAYRPVATAENNVCYARYYADTLGSP